MLLRISGVIDMKRKLLVVSLSALTCLSLGSCDILSNLGGLQGGLTAKEVRDYTEEVMDTTREYLVSLAEGDKYHLDIDTKFNAEYNISVENSSTYDSETSRESLSGSINGNATATAKLNLLEINKGSLKGSDGSLKGKLEAVNSYDDSITKDETKQKYEFDFSANDKELKVKVKDNDNNTNETYQMSAYETEVAASIAKAAIVFPEDLIFDLTIPSSGETSRIDFSILDEVNDKTNQFKDKEISALEYVEYLDSQFLGNELKNGLETEDYNLIVKVFEKHESILPEYFFIAKKTEEKGYTLLKGEFDYASWVVAFGVAVADILKEEVDDLESVLDLVERFTTSYLPSTFDMSYVLKVDNNGCFAGYTYDMRVQGNATEEVEWSNNSGSFVDTTKVNYTGSAHFELNFRAGNTPSPKK